MWALRLGAQRVQGMFCIVCSLLSMHVLGCVECANSLGDTVWSHRVWYQRVQPWIRPCGGQWTMYAQPKQTQPQPHSGELKSPVRRI